MEKRIFIKKIGKVQG